MGKLKRLPKQSFIMYKEKLKSLTTSKFKTLLFYTKKKTYIFYKPKYAFSTSGLFLNSSPLPAKATLPKSIT